MRACGKVQGSRVKGLVAAVEAVEAVEAHGYMRNGYGTARACHRILAEMAKQAGAKPRGNFHVDLCRIQYKINATLMQLLKEQIHV